MKNKLYILNLALLCVAQITSCMDEQQVVQIVSYEQQIGPMKGSIAFDNIDNICVRYFSKSSRKQSKKYFGIKIKKTTPCILANFVINYKCPRYPGDPVLSSQTKFVGPIPLDILITNSDKIMLPKAHLKHEKSSEQLTSIVQIAEKNFIEKCYIFHCHAYYKLEESKKEKQKLIDKKIIISSPTRELDYHLPEFGSEWSILQKGEHGPRGYGSPLQGKEGNIFELLMRREQTGFFRK